MSPRRKPSTSVDVEAAVDILEEILSQHWDLDPCRCWVCSRSVRAGCRPRARYLNNYRGRVWVDPALHEPKHWVGPGWGQQ